MANPPITIGPFTSVPAPGSPIRSDWPQSISTHVNGLPLGLLARQTKPTTEGGFGTAEFVIAGLGFTVPATPNRTHEVSFNLRCVTNTAGGAATMMWVSLRAGTSTTGTIVETRQYNFPQGGHPTYGADIVGTFMPTGLVVGQTYCLTTGTDGGGRWSISGGYSWSTRYDVS